MKNVIYTIITKNSEGYANLCVPSIVRYADSISADFFVLNESIASEQYPTNHFLIYDSFRHFANSEYDRMMYVDADVVINKNTPNIFEKFDIGFWVRQGWEWEKVDGYIRNYFGVPKKVFPRYFSSGLIVSGKEEILELNTHLHAPWHIGPWGGDQGQLNYALTECSFEPNILPYRWHFTRAWAKSSDAWKFGGDLMGAIKEAGCESLEEIYCIHYAGGNKIQQIVDDKEFLKKIGIELV